MRLGFKFVVQLINVTDWVLIPNLWHCSLGNTNQKTPESCLAWCLSKGRGGGAVAQSVERVTPVEEVVALIQGVATHSPLVGSVSV